MLRSALGLSCGLGLLRYTGYPGVTFVLSASSASSAPASRFFLRHDVVFVRGVAQGGCSKQTRMKHEKR